MNYVKISDDDHSSWNGEMERTYVLGKIGICLEVQQRVRFFGNVFVKRRHDAPDIAFVISKQSRGSSGNCTVLGWNAAIGTKSARVRRKRLAKRRTSLLYPNKLSFAPLLRLFFEELARRSAFSVRSWRFSAKSFTTESWEALKACAK
jgi:hypothetical protein